VKKDERTLVDEIFDSKRNVRGTKVPLNEHTKKLFLYLGLYAVIIFNLAVFMVALTAYAPELALSDATGNFMQSVLDFDITGMLSHNANETQTGDSPEGILSLVCSVLPYLSIVFLLILGFLVLFGLTATYVAGKTPSPASNQMISAVFLISVLLLVGQNYLCGVMPIVSSLILLILSLYTIFLFLLLKSAPRRPNRSWFTPHLDALIRKQNELIKKVSRR